MTTRLEAAPEQAYVRDVLFGIELLDAVTLERVSRGVNVEAVGLSGKPIVSASGFFVWRPEDLSALQKISIDPLLLPYEAVELTAAQLEMPLTIVELPPRANYPFGAGATGIRGALIETAPPWPRVPVTKAEVQVRWLDETGVWRDAPTVSHTNASGDFAAVLRLSPTEVPLFDADGTFTVRLRVQRDASERRSGDLKLKLGRIADALTFSWDELQP